MRALQVVDAMELAQAYAAAEYRVAHGADEVRLQVGKRAERLDAVCGASHHAFITAWNPASDPRPDDANVAADARLVARIESLGLGRHPARAQSPDGRWREPGWVLCDAGTDLALELAREYGQAGVLAWARGEPVRLCMLAPRPLRAGSAAPASGILWVADAVTA